MGDRDRTRASARSSGNGLALAATCIAAALLSSCGALASAADSPTPYTVGFGIQGSVFHCDSLCIYGQREPSGAAGSVDGAGLDNVSLSGTLAATPQFKLTLAGQYTGSGAQSGESQVDLLLAIVRLELSDPINIWIGRFFTPSDRQNLDGPYFTNDLTPFVDDVGAWYPSEHFGADDGIAYWGDFGRFKLSIGGFDGHSVASAVPDRNTVLGAARLMVDFWDKESGYLLRSASYGAQNVLALAIAGQSENGRSAWNVDGLLDRRLGASGVLTAEFEYLQDRALTASTASRGAFLMTSYLLPHRWAAGRLQPLLKYSLKRYEAAPAAPAYTLATLEANLNYIINGADALMGIYYLKQHDVLLAAGSSPPVSTRAQFIDPQELGLKIQFRL